MEAGTPQQPDDNRPHRDRARVGAWCQVAGAILAVVTLTCALFDVISVRQAIALAVPAALLIIGGLIAAASPEASTGQRSGFQVGLRVGSLLSTLRSFFRGPGGGGLADVLRLLSRRFLSRRRGPRRPYWMLCVEFFSAPGTERNPRWA